MHRRALPAVFGLFIFFMIDTHAQTAEVCVRDLKVSSSTKAPWSPGVVPSNGGSAGGFQYEIQLKVKKNAALEFKELIVGDQRYQVEVVKGSDRLAKGPWSKGDQLLIIARSDRSSGGAAAASEIIARLRSKKAEGGLLYTMGDKQFLLPVSRFTLKSNNNLSK